MGEQGSGRVPGDRHGHIMSLSVIGRLKLNQVGLDVGGVDLPRGSEAPEADVREGQGPRLDQFWRKGRRWNLKTFILRWFLQKPSCLCGSLYTTSSVLWAGKFSCFLLAEANRFKGEGLN